MPPPNSAYSESVACCFIGKLIPQVLPSLMEEVSKSFKLKKMCEEFQTRLIFPSTSTPFAAKQTDVCQLLILNLHADANLSRLILNNKTVL